MLALGFSSGKIFLEPRKRFDSLCPQSAADDTQAEDEAKIEVDLGKIELGTLTEGGGHKQSNACCLYGKPTHSINTSLGFVNQV